MTELLPASLLTISPCFMICKILMTYDFIFTYSSFSLSTFVWNTTSMVGLLLPLDLQCVPGEIQNLQNLIVTFCSFFQFSFLTFYQFNYHCWGVCVDVDTETFQKCNKKTIYGSHCLFINWTVLKNNSNGNHAIAMLNLSPSSAHSSSSLCVSWSRICWRWENTTSQTSPSSTALAR